MDCELQEYITDTNSIVYNQIKIFFKTYLIVLPKFSRLKEIIYEKSLLNGWTKFEKEMYFLINLNTMGKTCTSLLRV